MDLTKKIEQIETIDDEVDVLHPLLREVLPKLEGIVDFDYTHGTNEMGADFILERRDEAVSATHYIGVVAKTDKILQNFTEIERQIDECTTIKRTFKGQSEILCVRHIMLSERSRYAETRQEDAKSQRCRASGGVYRDTAGAA